MDHVLIKSVQTNLWSLTETDTKEEKNDLFVSDCSFSASISYNELYTFLFKTKEKNLHYRWQLNTMHNYASIMFRVININWQLNSRHGEKKDEQKEIDQAVSY